MIIGPKMLAVYNAVRAKPGQTKYAIGEALYGKERERDGYFTVGRAIRAGLLYAQPDYNQRTALYVMPVGTMSDRILRALATAYRVHLGQVPDDVAKQLHVRGFTA